MPLLPPGNQHTEKERYHQRREWRFSREGTHDAERHVRLSALFDRGSNAATGSFNSIRGRLDRGSAFVSHESTIHLVRVVVASLLIAAMEVPALRTTPSSSPGESFNRLRMMRT